MISIAKSRKLLKTIVLVFACTGFNQLGSIATLSQAHAKNYLKSPLTKLGLKHGVNKASENTSRVITVELKILS